MTLTNNIFGKLVRFFKVHRDAVFEDLGTSGIQHWLGLIAYGCEAGEEGQVQGEGQ